MQDETFVRLKIISTSVAPERISEMLGVNCDESWHVGDRRMTSRIVESTAGWILGSGLPRSASLELHVEALSKKLESITDLVSEFARSDEEYVEFSCVVYAVSPPALNFVEKTIKLINKLGARLDIDLYILESDRTN